MFQDKDDLLKHDFVERTDRKSLYTQIKMLVSRAQDVANAELDVRRKALHKLLEFEDKIYEEEFANKVKSRIDEDIQERKDVLLKIKEESSRNETKFLDSKRIQLYMNSCYEIREALRQQERMNVKECQLEQIVEKERAIKRELELDKYWQRVQEVNLAKADQRIQEERCLREAISKQTVEGLDEQLLILAAKREELRQEKLEEKKRIETIMEEIRLEDFDLKINRGVSEKALQYRNELLAAIAERKALKEQQLLKEADMHRQLMAEISRLEAEEALIAADKKHAFYKATMEFITYSRKMRELENQHLKMIDNRIDDLRHVDVCTKSNIKQERERRAKRAEACYAELRKQICEQYERRIREEAERKECKIIENRFVHNDKTREEILAQRRQNRIDLDRQIETLKRIRAEEEAHFHDKIQRASNDPEFCQQLAEEYIKEGVDYLETHANWRILACPPHVYVPKPPAKDETELMSKTGKCIAPCSCKSPGTKLHCPRIYYDGRGDEIRHKK